MSLTTRNYGTPTAPRGSAQTPAHWAWCRPTTESGYEHWTWCPIVLSQRRKGSPDAHLAALVSVEPEFRPICRVSVGTSEKSKNDTRRRWHNSRSPYGSHPATCPVRAWRRWLVLSGIDTGPAFRSVDRHGNLGTKRLSDRAVATWSSAARSQSVSTARSPVIRCGPASPPRATQGTPELAIMRHGSLALGVGDARLRRGGARSGTTTPQQGSGCSPPRRQRHPDTTIATRRPGQRGGPRRTHGALGGPSPGWWLGHGVVRGWECSTSVGAVRGIAAPVGERTDLRRRRSSRPGRSAATLERGLPLAEELQDRIQLGVEAIEPLIRGREALADVGEPGVDFLIHRLEQLVQRVDVGTLLPHLALDLRCGHGAETIACRPTRDPEPAPRSRAG